MVYKFKIIVGKHNLNDQFQKRFKHYKKVENKIMQQSACLVVNPITVYTFCFLFSYTMVGQASDSMTALAQSFNRLVGA